MKLGTFSVDFTPPAGFPIGFGAPFEPKSEGVADPLMLRGFVIEDGPSRNVIAALDYCALMNSAQDDILSALGEAFGIPEGNVVVHCVHQHDAPLIDFELEPYLGTCHSREWWLGLLKKAAASARKSLSGMKEIASIGHAETRIQGYASNRRILGEDGKVSAMRWSRCGNAEVRDKPTGNIDPMLRTLAFKGTNGQLLGSMSFYATHPQVANGRRLYSADAPGEALRRTSENAPGPLHAFLTGAGGNISAGKYASTDDLEGNIKRFGGILADGIARNLAVLQWEAPGHLEWRKVSFPFPLKKAAPENLELIKNPSTPDPERLLLAVARTILDYKPNRTYTATVARLGGCRLLFLPGEPFVEYQLWTQSLVPDEFLALAANCGDSFVYIPTERAFAQGGYEPSLSGCLKTFERRFKKHMAPAILN